MDNGYNTRELSPAQQRIKDKVGNDAWIERRKNFLRDIRAKHDYLVDNNDEMMEELLPDIKNRFKNDETTIYRGGDIIFVYTADENIVREIADYVNKLGIGLSLKKGFKMWKNGREMQGYMIKSKNNRTIG